MVLQFEDFTKAASEVDRIIQLPDHADLKSELIKSAEEISAEKKKEYFRHMNSLFLNILLNRLNEFGPDVEERTVNARRTVVELINGR